MAKPHDQHIPTLHYNKEELLKDYTETYRVFIIALFLGIGGAVAYFFILIVYLGGHGHTPTVDYAKEFNSQYPQEYTGLKLPAFGGPEAPVKKAHGDTHATPAGH